MFPLCGFKKLIHVTKLMTDFLNTVTSALQRKKFFIYLSVLYKMILTLGFLCPTLLLLCGDFVTLF